jgi:hypothetical protein
VKLKHLLSLPIFFVSATITAGEPPLVDIARGFGVSTCLPQLQSIHTFLNAEAGANGALVNASKEQADKRLVAALNLLKYDDGTWGVSTIGVAPRGGGECDGVMTRVITYPGKSCSSIREVQLKGFSYKGELAGKAVYESGNLSAVLEDLTGSCVLVRYEAIYPIPK